MGIGGAVGAGPVVGADVAVGWAVDGSATTVDIDVDSGVGAGPVVDTRGGSDVEVGWSTGVVVGIGGSCEGAAVQANPITRIMTNRSSFISSFPFCIVPEGKCETSCEILTVTGVPQLLQPEKGEGLPAGSPPSAPESSIMQWYPHSSSPVKKRLTPRAVGLRPHHGNRQYVKPAAELGLLSSFEKVAKPYILG